MKLSLLLILSLVLTGCRAVEEEPYQTPDDEMVVIPKEPEKRISFYKGVSEKTPGFNQGMNHVSNGPH